MNTAKKRKYIDPSAGFFNKQDRPKLIMAAITGVLITVTYLMFKEDFPRDFIQILPLYVSLIVMFLQSGANRYGFLLGGFNALFYAGVYVSFGLYASAVSAAAISFPLQILTFIQWGKHPYGKSTMFRKLGPKRLTICLAILAAAFGICYFIFSALGSQHLLLDNASLIFGTVVTILTTLAYIEYLYLQFISQGISFALSLALALNTPSRTPYVVYSVYCTICVILTAVRVFGLYRQQQESISEKAQ